MANLIVRNVDDAVAQALKVRASQRGVSAEAEHRKILEQILLKKRPKSFYQALADIPHVGQDTDFERHPDVQSGTPDIFD